MVVGCDAWEVEGVRWAAEAAAAEEEEEEAAAAAAAESSVEEEERGGSDAPCPAPAPASEERGVGWLPFALAEEAREWAWEGWCKGEGAAMGVEEVCPAAALPMDARVVREVKASPLLLPLLP